MRQFTPLEATETLPLVRQIVSDILRTGRELRDLAAKLGGKFQTSQEARPLLRELDELMAELDGIGCSYKDWNFEIGLVDFPAVIDGKQVLLCWRSDEAGLGFYHGLEDGYAGRRPIPTELFRG